MAQFRQHDKWFRFFLTREGLSIPSKNHDEVLAEGNRVAEKGALTFSCQIGIDTGSERCSSPIVGMAVPSVKCNSGPGDRLE